MDRQSTEAFQGSARTLYDTTTMDTCHNTFVQMYRMHCTRSSQPFALPRPHRKNCPGPHINYTHTNNS